MTSLSGLKYAPMLFDASDVTTLIKRRGLLLQSQKQVSNVLDYKYYLSPGEVVSAAIGKQYCLYTVSQYCKLPTILPTIVSGFTAESIALPS